MFLRLFFGLKKCLVGVQENRQGGGGSMQFWQCPNMSRFFFVMDGFHKSSFSSKSSKHLHFKTRRARAQKFRENVHSPPCVTCHVSHVTCHMSRVTCHMSLNYFYKEVKLVARGYVINRAYPV